jgi:thiamine-monophosphate kinase
MREAELIQKISKGAAKSSFGRHAELLGIGDDAALWKPRPGHEVILSCDWFLEGTHFLRDKHPPDAVGWKALARALSDIAAMGGAPVCFLLALALPTDLTGRWLDAFLGGMGRAARKFSCPLVGGDTTRRSEVLINLTVIGQIASRRALLRSGARPGHSLFVSGRLGEAELGLWLLRKFGRIPSRGKSRAFLSKHLYPEPRLALGRWLAEQRLASAMIDLSDGLSTDLPRLCASSNVGARIEAAKIPTVRMALSMPERSPDSLELALHGGDDYELLFSVPAKKVPQVPRSYGGVRITRIGEVTKPGSIVLVDRNGCELPFANRGWDPFRET